MSHGPTGTPARYYPYIDGLRALAVLSVLVYHLHGPWLPGGFVGVDVFFVISGFVVSASIASFKGQGLWQFLAYFYARRIRRIFPALIACLLLTSLVSALFIPSIWLSEVNQRTGIYAFFGLSNFILAQTGRDYFAPTTEFNPYTHTWSLAVEEQFYLVFPFLFLAWLSGPRGRKLSVLLFAATAAASVVLAGWQSQANPTQAYFLTPARFWELAAGVLLYQLLSQLPERTSEARHTWLYALAASLSLMLVLLAFVVSTPQRFPMPGALLAVVGTLGVLGLLYHHAGLHRLHNLLGSRPLVAVGRISYSLYLWHWPVFVLFRWTVGLETPLQRTLAVALAFALAMASYRWIETPVRHAAFMRRIPQPAVIACGLLIILAGWSGARYIDEKQPQLSLSSVSRAPDDWYPRGASSFRDFPGCIADPEYRVVNGATLMLYTPHGCTEPRPLKERVLYVIGDSHAMAYEGLFKQYAIEQSIRVHAYVKSGCAFISLQPWNNDPACRQFARDVLHSLTDLKAGDVLFLPSLRLPRFADQWAFLGMEQAYDGMFGAQADAGRRQVVDETIVMLREFTERGVQVVFEAPKPLFKAPPFRCTDWFNQANPICAQGLEISRQQLQEYRQPVLTAFAEIQRQLPTIGIWDPFPILCPADTCSAWHEARPLFLDADHISGYGNSRLLADFSTYMNARLESPLARHTP
ncbi:acyltransferase family protein [Pseudomonas yangonensis]|uniref:acyltransferase family protein n=1 Tax=Pseudomonas yangonensis TaxID=2579922 RepID=UPI00137B1BE8|nr:acyltransferase family protein [Pseudomonas yangonensis]